MDIINRCELTEKEVIETIIKKPKFYEGVMSQSSASLLIKRWRQGKAKHKTVEEFMRKFGYVLDQPATYKHIQDE